MHNAPPPPNSIALWAETVPHMPPMTTDELHAIPDDGWTYELVQGVLVRMPMSSGGTSNSSARLIVRLGAYVEDNNLGVITTEQGGYRLDPTNPRTTEVAPDVAFVRAERAPARTSPEYYGQAWPLAPDLAVEAVSENQYAPGMAAKAQTYLTFGTQLVWVIRPRYQRVDVWHLGDLSVVRLNSTLTWHTGSERQHTRSEDPLRWAERGGHALSQTTEFEGRRFAIVVRSSVTSGALGWRGAPPADLIA